MESELRAHIESEESTLARIERCLDGNGQVGLVRSHVSHDERIRALEGLKTMMLRLSIAAVTAAFTGIASLIAFFVQQHWRP
jgi:hypothetical protein